MIAVILIETAICLAVHVPFFLVVITFIIVSSLEMTEKFFRKISSSIDCANARARALTKISKCRCMH